MPSSYDYDDIDRRRRQQRIDDRIDELLDGCENLTDPHDHEPSCPSPRYATFPCPRCHCVTLLGWWRGVDRSSSGSGTECYYCDRCGAEIEDGVVMRRRHDKEEGTQNE